MARFKVETRKSIPGYSWTNTYGVEAAGIIPASNVGLALAAFEASFLWDGAQVDDVKTSPWPAPNSSSFLISPANMGGGVVMANPEPAEMCLFVSILTALGHPGRKWYRMSLNEADVVTVAGKATLVPGAGLIAILEDAWDDLVATLNTLDGDLLIGAGYLTAREWNEEVAIKGIGFRDTDIGWYDKGA